MLLNGDVVLGFLVLQRKCVITHEYRTKDNDSIRDRRSKVFTPSITNDAHVWQSFDYEPAWFRLVAGID